MSTPIDFSDRDVHEDIVRRFTSLRRKRSGWWKRSLRRLLRFRPLWLISRGQADPYVATLGGSIEKSSKSHGQSARAPHESRLVSAWRGRSAVFQAFEEVIVLVRARWRWARGHCPRCNRNLYASFSYYMAAYPNCSVCKGETVADSPMWRKHRALGMAAPHLRQANPSARTAADLSSASAD
jgi:hypothetical protein